MNDLLADIKTGGDEVSTQLESLKVSGPRAPAAAATPSPDKAASSSSMGSAPEKKKRFGFMRRKASADSPTAIPSASDTPRGDASTGGEAPVAEDEPEEEAPVPSLSNQQFMNDVTRVKKLLETIAAKRAGIEALHEKAKTMTKSPDIIQAQQDTNRDMTLIKTCAKEAKDTIQRLQADDEAEGLDVTSGTNRMRHTITSGLVTRLKRELDGFREFEVKVGDEYREVVERRVRVVTGQEIDEDQVDTMIESGQAEAMFRAALQQQTSTAVADVFTQTEERYNGMRQLNEDLQHLHQMMLDFATLVSEQGQLLDNIEMQVGVAADYVRDGTDEILVAKGYKKSKEKTKAAITGVAAGAAAATAAVGAGVIAAPLAL